ncbi:putative E3 ubiquitin-protein ligase protein PFF1365c [Leptopilina heterotoma]|uniref:putative E3 ubiquitin-protein ligase protein PFF1365c n=1 Tax=Leptopilina heterotoma TaxID=63436 RepID=UPI001CA93B0F|nr:putative E3 ubiquitin-protein ligase protein PFF1365c [Leptopilina heterotoma]XP_043465350.1 putative E3 ubiquitin-protein ligase protein PFF1365c [Leptopilina heterotoma]XP_043465351.1 putative E3 ubiquitin-protein ligase protein PFF1365c [Leptopilina heterotoma]
MHVKPEETGMTPSPTANRSFLHGDRQSSCLNSDKIVYATLDSLALKRVTLPLKLLPIDNDHVVDNSAKIDNKEKIISRKMSSRKPSFKTRTASNIQWKIRSRLNQNSKAENQREVMKKSVSLNRRSNKKLLKDSKVPIITKHDSCHMKSNTLPRDSKLNENVTRTCEETKEKDDNFNPSLIIDSELYDDVFTTSVNNLSIEKSEDEQNLDLDISSISINSYNLSNQSDTSGYGSNNNTNNSSSIQLNDNSMCNINNNIIENIEIRKNDNEKQFINDEKSKKKYKYFTKNVLHYVPISNHVKRYKKLRKNRLSLSLGSLKNNQIDSKFDLDDSAKCRSLSRTELKYVTISSPTNFVHVASATNPKLLVNSDSNSCTKQNVITHEQKFVDLRIFKMDQLHNYEKMDKINGRPSFLLSETDGRGYVEIKKLPFTTDNDPSYDSVSENQSVKVENLENCQTKNDENEVDEKIYEPVSEFSPYNGLKANSSFLWSERRKNSENHENSSSSDHSKDENTYEEFDDIGTSFENDDYDDVGFSKNEKFDNVYDDVMPRSCQMEQHFSSTSTLEINDYLIMKTKVEIESNEFEKKDDSERSSNYENYAVNNDYSSVDEDDDDDEIKEENEQGVYDDVDLPCQERVNSLYAGSSTGSQPGSSLNGKESEWEDLEDAKPSLLVPKRNVTCIREAHGTPSKKKLGQRWSRKIRGQRTKVTRKSSGRSTSQTICDRVVLFETTSDDSNYETLYSYQIDDFSTDSEAEEENCDSTQISRTIFNENLEPPTRPTPPPPREASLTQSLGRRMKILRRTWTITKGSLGRMRRRTSGDDSTYKSVNNHSVTNNDNSKYFSFKKHFRKSISGLSTFYLENNQENGNVKDNQSNSSIKEGIYSNSNWYTDTDIWRDDSSSLQSEVNSADHYSVLMEEPLYQFYAAAAARVAFESDSDGYEEVEDITPSSAAMELAKPGHRTLWCQTPQVIHSGLLQSLTVEEKKMQEAKFEIVTSEASYLNSLRVLNNEFVTNNELVNETLTQVERDKLFGGVSCVLMSSERFLAEMENVWKEDPMLLGLPDVLLKHAERSLAIYVTYCSSQVSIDSTLKELRARKGLKFLEVVSRIEMRPSCQSLSLHSFLMLPMQRVTRLPLLADAVLSKIPMNHQERASWERVLSHLSFVVAECNEGARAASQLIEMETLARKLEYSPKVPPIDLRERKLIRSGTVTQLSMKSDTEYKLTFGKKFQKTPLFLLLLTDYLLVTKLKASNHEDTYAVIDLCKRSLVALESVPENSPFSGRHAMVLTLLENHLERQMEYVITCESDTEKERWLDAVSPPKSNLVGETLYESWDCPQVMALYSYSPGQPDELAMQPGDVINVSRKMADGWYHGEKLLDGEQGWFPGNYTKEVASEHVRARNLKQRHRLLALNGSVLQRRAKQSMAIH